VQAVREGLVGAMAVAVALALSIIGVVALVIS
jgi:hypothetical protein